MEDTLKPAAFSPVEVVPFSKVTNAIGKGPMYVEQSWKFVPLWIRYFSSQALHNA